MIPLPNPPRAARAQGEGVLAWAREVQQCLRDIRSAFGSLPDPRPPARPHASAIAASSHPFRVITRSKPGSTTGAMEAGVVIHSSLYKSLKPDDKFSIAGLLSADKTAGWFDLEPTDAIWLGITFGTDGKPDWAGIDSWGQGDSFEIDADAWSGDNGYCEDDGGNPPKHQTSRKLIAYSVPGDQGQPVLTQVMFHDQILRHVCIDGKPARYPFDHEGGYPL